MKIYAQGQTALLFVTFATTQGEAATISGTPTVNIYHRWGSTTKTDVNAANLTQLSATTYYYSFHIPSGGDKTDYAVKYAATYSNGTSAIGSEEFRVVDSDFYKKPLAGTSRTTVVKTVWTDREKLALVKSIKMLETLTNNLGESIKMLTDVNKTISGNLDKVSTKVFESEKRLVKMEDSTKKDITKKIGTISETQQLEFEELSKANKEANEKVMEMRSQLEKANMEFGKALSEMTSDIDELASLVVKSLPVDKLKEVALENKREDKERVQAEEKGD